MENLFSVEYDLRGLNLGLLEFWLPKDDLSNEGKTANQVSDDLLFPTTYLSTPVARGEVARKLLEDLEQIPIEEELYNWCEEKIDLSIFDTLPTGMDLDMDSENGQGVNTTMPELDKTAMNENSGMNMRKKALPLRDVKREITAVDVLELPELGMEPEIQVLNVKKESLPLDTQRLMLETEHATKTTDKNNICKTPPQGLSLEGSSSAPAVITLMQTSNDGEVKPLGIIGRFVGNTAEHADETREFKEVNEFVRKEAESILAPVEGGFIEAKQPEQILPDLEPVSAVQKVECGSPVYIDYSSSSSIDSSYSVMASTSDSTGHYVVRSPTSSSESVPSPSSSSSSVFEALSPDLSLTCNDSDLEWLPTNETETSQSRQQKPHSRQSQTKSLTPKQQPRGHSMNNNLSEKKLRKKEQNKSAATRYRMKKKLEFEGINKELKGQTERNQELRQKATNIAHEIKYLKGLMREVFKAKGILRVPSCST